MAPRAVSPAQTLTRFSVLVSVQSVDSRAPSPGAGYHWRTVVARDGMDAITATELELDHTLDPTRESARVVAAVSPARPAVRR